MRPLKFSIEEDRAGARANATRERKGKIIRWTRRPAEAEAAGSSSSLVER